MLFGFCFKWSGWHRHGLSAQAALAVCGVHHLIWPLSSVLSGVLWYLLSVFWPSCGLHEAAQLWPIGSLLCLLQCLEQDTPSSCLGWSLQWITHAICCGSASCWHILPASFLMCETLSQVLSCRWVHWKETSVYPMGSWGQHKAACVLAMLGLAMLLIRQHGVHALPFGLWV